MGGFASSFGNAMQPGARPGVQQAQPFGGAQSMPAMYGQNGQLNLASMAPGSPMAQMAQRMGGQSAGLTGYGGVPQQQPFQAAQQFATNGQINPQLQAQQFGQQGAFNPMQMGTMQPGFTGAGTVNPPGFTGGLRRAPMGYKPPGRF